MTHKATFYTGHGFLIKLTIHRSRVVLWAPGGGSASGYMKNQTKGFVILHYRDQCITHASGQHDMSPNARYALHIIREREERVLALGSHVLDPQFLKVPMSAGYDGTHL